MYYYSLLLQAAMFALHRTEFETGLPTIFTVHAYHVRRVTTKAAYILCSVPIQI